MVKAFTLLGFTAVLFLSQGCGGKKPVASNPSSSQPSVSQSGSSGNDGGASGGGGPSESTTMAMPSGPGGGMQSDQSPGSGDGSSAQMGMPSGFEGGGMSPGGNELSNKGGNNFANNSRNNQPQAGFGTFNPPRAMPRIAPPPTLKDQAVNAFQSGNPKRAYAYLQAHALHVTDEEAADTLKHYRWASHKKRPQLGLNIAVGVALKNPRNVTDLSPIGTQTQNNASGGEMGMSAMAGMGGPAANAEKTKTFAETTGSFGTQLVAAFKEKHESGTWSPAFSEYSLVTNRGNGFGSMAGAFGGTNLGGFDGGAGNPGGFSNQFGAVDGGGQPGYPSGDGGQPTGNPFGGAQPGQPAGYPTGQSGQPDGYPTGGAQSGPPAGYPSGGPPSGYPAGGPQSGPPAGYPSGGPPSGYPSGGPQSGPPAGYPSGGPPSGYPSGGAQSGPPAGYSAGGPQGVGGPGSPLQFQGKGMALLGGPGLAGPGGEPEPGPGLAGPGLAGPGFPGPGTPGPSAFGPGTPGPGTPDSGMMGGPGFGNPGMGGPGMGNPGMGGPGMGGPGMGGNAPQLSTDPKLPAGSSPLAPCLTFIGVDEASKLMKKAWQEGYDGLMLFEVTIGVNQIIQKVTNDTLVRVVQPNSVPKDVKRIYVSKSFNNIQFARSKAKGEPDGLSEAIEKVIKGTEEGLALQSFPSALTPEIIATKRIPTLIKDTELSVLDRLSEVNLYYYKGFIDETRKADAFEQIAGQPGRVIATGSPVERLAAIEKLLEREFK